MALGIKFFYQEKEKIVTASSQSGDVKSKEETIKEDIQAIYDLLAKNKNRIGSLSKKLKDSKSKNCCFIVDYSKKY